MTAAGVLASGPADDPGIPGEIGLLCIRNQDGSKATFGHASHYTYWSADLPAETARHITGKTGSRFVARVRAAGLTFTQTRTTTGSRYKERAIKLLLGGQTRYCPACTPNPRGSLWERDLTQYELDLIKARNAWLAGIIARERAVKNGK